MEENLNDGTHTHIGGGICILGKEMIITQGLLDLLLDIGSDVYLPKMNKKFKV